ncbi:glucose dehydrogenase [FAD, quinone]-like [Episyrphus balteatus]|uniref:glucose dehydrogenase [FAD, quinone]-like n=1 Tax=Episyrphus balteatus TaxID=286459 RepID=UPI00248569E0|nr:glucose dehydrogenase [FAD, quinone]-like [Episyrphus balteatus]
MIFFLSPHIGKTQIVNLLVDLLALGIDTVNLILNLFKVTYNIFPSSVPRQNGIYDFKIVGAGPAGCVLANRLSENPNWTVYLLEAGGSENFLHEVPAFVSVLQKTNSNWDYKSVPQKNACYGMYGKVCGLPRGKVLGGTSSINFMIYNRGNRRDFDRWAENGNIGWSYNEVLPLFKRIEAANLEGFEYSDYHNTTGPLSVEAVSFRTEIVHAYVNGAQQAGYRLNDYNGQSQIGVSFVQASTLNGHRHSASKAYLEPVKKKRKNLHVLTFALVTKILIDPKTNSAYGVEFLHKERKYTIRGRKEVILSAGAFNSPQLLMLSGIGPKEVLSPIGIPQIKELPVGKRLFDHMSFVGPLFTVNTTKQTLFLNRITPVDLVKFKTGDGSTILSSIGGVEALTFIKTPNSNEPADFPDVELILISTSLAGDYGTGFKEGANFRDDIYDKMFKPLENKEHFGFLITHFHPQSMGRLWLKNNNPKIPPIIDPQFFEIPEDVEYILEGVKEAIRITKTSAMQKIGATLYRIPTPGCESITFASDDYWRCSIRTLSYTLHHQVATCKMGPQSDPTSVVSPQLKVHGIRKLRVVDTSIIPFPPTCHVNAASFMIGEKAYDMIRDEWSGR